jgi:hypothetical protein
VWGGWQAELDSYLRGRPNAVFLADLPAHLFLTSAGEIAAAGKPYTLHPTPYTLHPKP